LHAAPAKNYERAPPLRDLSLEIQEAFILEDMLAVLLGIEGIYITRVGAEDPAQFAVDHGLDPALRDLVGRMLPLATHYCASVVFVEARAHIEFGAVCHALCAAVRSVLKVSAVYFRFETRLTFTGRTIPL
jgi:gamma-tubulin complex component 2